MPLPRQDNLAEKIRHLLAHQNASALRRLLAKQNFADIAEVMQSVLTEDEAITTFQYMEIGQAGQVLASLGEERQLACLSSLPAVMGSRILRQMPIDDAVDILQELDTEHTQKIIREMPLDIETRNIQHLLLEEPDTAAGLMSTEYIALPVDTTVGEAMARIRQAEEKDFIYYCYLVDASNRMVGVVSLKKLIVHDDSVPISRFAEFDAKSLLTTYDQELVANLFRKYDNLLAMPVVDLDGVLRGIITLDDIVYVIEEESSEDIYQASGIQIEQIEEKSLMAGPVINAIKARLPWLSVTVFGQLLAAMIIASYQHTVSAAVIAISFMPLLTGLAGNMGTQTSTIAVRALGQGLISADNIWQKLRRELKVAVITGVTFGVSVGGLSFFIYHHWQLSLLLLSWIMISVCLSAVTGLMVPYVFDKHFNTDPASVGGPLITTVSDILTFTVYLYVLTTMLDRMI